MRRKKYLMTLALAAAVALGASACGSSGTSSASGNSGAQSAKVIVVGSICSCSGPQGGSFTGYQSVVQAWQDYTNAHGGLNGHPVKVYVVDDAGNPSTGLTDVKQLIAQDHVVAIIGDESATDNVWGAYVKSAGVPVVGGHSYTAPFATNSDFFPSSAGLGVFIVGMVQQLALDKQKGFGIWACTENPACAEIGDLAKVAAKVVPNAPKITVGSISAAQPNYDAQCLSMKSAGATATWNTEAAATVTATLQSCAQQNYHPILASGNLPSREYFTLSSAQHGIFISPDVVYTDTSIPGVATYIAALTKYAPSALAQQESSFEIYAGWVGMQLFAVAAKAGNIGPASTSADVKKALYSLHGETVGGMAPPLTFTPGKPTFVSCYFTTTIDNNQPVALNGAKPSCLDPAQIAALAG